MSRAIKITVLVVATMVFGPAMSQAYVFTVWDTPQVQPLQDVNHVSPGLEGGGQSITGAYHYFDGTYQYFRMDLAAAIPSSATALTYGIYFDAIEGFGAPAGVQGTGPDSPGDRLHPHVPATAGIDYILRTNFASDGVNAASYRWNSDPGWANFEYSNFTGGFVFAYSTADGTNPTTLEWRFDPSGTPLSGNSFYWQMATLSEGGCVRDLVGNVRPSATPIPAAAWLFGSGLVGLIGFGRWKGRAA